MRDITRCMILFFCLSRSVYSIAADNPGEYAKRLASSEGIKTTIKIAEREHGSFVISTHVFRRLCVQASEDPAFKIDSIKELILVVHPDNDYGILINYDGADTFRNLLNYIPWNGDIDHGNFATYYGVYLNGQHTRFLMHGMRDSAGCPVYMPELTYPGTVLFESDTVRRTNLENGYKALYERAQQSVCVKEDDNQFSE